ncbi:hypothetical protein RQP46_007180 [Phenoliferia psychrophenolica]
MAPPTASTSNLRLTAAAPTPGDDNEFIQFRATMRLPIAPIWGSDGKSAGGPNGSGGMDGVREVLAGWVMRYLPPLRAVLLTFNPIPTFAHPSATFPLAASPFPPPSSTRSRDPTRLLKSPGPDDDDEDDDPVPETVELISLPMIAGSGFALPTVEFQGLAWRPRIGQRIVGSPSLSTPSHISLLLHNLFNASIPASQIPTDLYHFDSDYPVPEAIQARQRLETTFPTQVLAQAAVAVEEPAEGEEESEEEDEESKAERLQQEEEDRVKTEEELERATYGAHGWWRHKVTNEPLGGAEGRVEFVIVGLTISDSMISVTGSLLPDPFAVRIKRAPSVQPTATKKRRRADDDSSDSDDSSDDDEEPLKVPPPIIVSQPESDSESESEAEVPAKKEKKVKVDKRVKGDKRVKAEKGTKAKKMKAGK